MDIGRVVSEYHRLLSLGRAIPRKAFLDSFLEVACAESKGAVAEVLLVDSASPAGIECGLGDQPYVASTFHMHVADAYDTRPMNGELLAGAHREIVLPMRPSQTRVYASSHPLVWSLAVEAGSRIKAPLVASFHLDGRSEETRGILVGVGTPYRAYADRGASDLPAELSGWHVGDGPGCVPLPPDIASIAVVPFGFSVPLGRTTAESSTASGLLIMGMQNDPAEAHRLAVLGPMIGSYLTSLFGTVRTIVVDELHRALLRTDSFSGKMGKVCVAAAKVTAAQDEDGRERDVPQGSYAHIRTFVPMDMHGDAGVLFMDNNAGYDLSAPTMDDAAPCRRIPRLPQDSSPVEVTEDILRTYGPQERSISREVFMRTRARGGAQVDDLSSLAAVEPVKLEHALVPGRAASPSDADDTASMICVPITDGDGSALGTLTVNSSCYGWLHRYWLPSLLFLAEEAALVIMHEHGMRIGRNESLLFKEEQLDRVFGGLREALEHGLDQRHLTDLLRGIYRSRWLYKSARVTLLPGHGRGYTFKVTINRADRALDFRTFVNVVRVLPRDLARIESRKYERLKAVCDTGRFTAKIGEDVVGSWGAIAYLFVGGGRCEVENLEALVDEANPRAVRTADELHRHLGEVRKILADLYGKALRGMHADGVGAYGSEGRTPDMVTLYERLSPDEAPRLNDMDYMFDTENPGLFGRDQLEMAMARAPDTIIAAFISKYLRCRDAMRSMDIEPFIGMCHGDLHPRNVLVCDKMCWLIDFGRLHRGHVLQDFARLESYVAHRLLTNGYIEGDPHSAAEFVARCCNRIGMAQPDCPPYDGFDDDLEATRQAYGLYAAACLGWRACIRHHAMDLSRLLGLGGGDTEHVREEYQLALVFQYLDWTTFHGSQRSREVNDQLRRGVEVLAGEGVRILQELFDDT